MVQGVLAGVRIECINAMVKGDMCHVSIYHANSMTKFVCYCSIFSIIYLTKKTKADVTKSRLWKGQLQVQLSIIGLGARS